ncbi:uncharacterized protein LOC109602177 [Aethina tumida]|uniref:uncharacterized protein LOC109602177 n=1 Tax=Aethina tumida TaxID=116153 RepID=UPI002147DA9E|nr:uncharacterized protein LOC109602177 [Aethina tumida]
MIRLLLVLFYLNCVYCQFFGFPGFYDPYAIAWAQRESLKTCVVSTDYGDVVGECTSSITCALHGGTATQACGVNGICCHYPPKTKSCTATSEGGVVEGKCITDAKCKNSGGTPKGSCGFLEKCCVYDNSCNRITSSKVSYFTGKVTKTNDISSCPYTIYLENTNVCQIRLDFESFKLASSKHDGSKYACSTDSFSIEPNHYGIPDMCGSNQNNHVYIHVHPGDSYVTLTMKLSKRSNVDLVDLPEWKIKVTQLQCGGNGKNDYLSQYDFPLLAPKGAIQYYTQSTGTIRSFGFNIDKSSSYTFNQNYAIAIRKDPGYCGAAFKAQTAHMQIPTNSKNPEADCKDYLSIPGLVDTQFNHLVKICKAHDFKSVVPGPLIINVHSEPQQTLDTAPYEFRFDYEMLTACT